MEVFKSPAKYIAYADYTKIFLAGSIEMGKAVDWQTELTNKLTDLDKVTILNPRRDDWDKSWPNTADFPPFREQVEWELQALEDADIIVMYFDPNTQSPITLLELGLFKGKAMVVCCPDGYFRKGNVDIVCEKYDIPHTNDKDLFFDKIYNFLKSLEDPIKSKIQ